MKSDNLKHIASVIMAVAFMAFVYGTYKAIKIVDKTQISTSDGIYTSYISDELDIKIKAYELSRKCESDICKVQTLLDYVTKIPYVTRRFQQKSPQKTMKDNFGDCDDKSNLLISLLHALDIEAYFVLVPKHIFVIVPLDSRWVIHKKGLWINGKKYYILESTVNDSKIGFPLHYELDEIEAIIEPFSNKKIEIKSLKYKL